VSALGTVAKVLSSPEVRAIVLPLAEQVVRWVRGGQKPEWIDGAVREVPSIKNAVDALAAARQRKAAK